MSKQKWLPIMNIKNIALFLLYLFVANCEKSDTKKNEVPKVKFDFSKMPKENIKYNNNKYVNDLEALLTEDQVKALELYLSKIEIEHQVKITLVTIPSKKLSSNEEWLITSSLTYNNVILSLSESMKTVNLAIGKNVKTKFNTDSISFKEDLLKKNYYDFLKKNITKITEQI